MRILIVDDEDHIRKMMRLTLEAAGHAVEEAADGQTGLASFGDGAGWDAVLLDQRMAGLEGTEVLREMRRRKPDAVVILVTAYASIDLVIEAMHLGATDFLRKPMTPEALRGAVAAAAARAAHTPVAPGSSRVAPGPIETITMNGFHIRYRGMRDGRGGNRGASVYRDALSPVASARSVGRDRSGSGRSRGTAHPPRARGRPEGSGGIRRKDCSPPTCGPKTPSRVPTSFA